MNARGVFFGLSLEHDLRHMARALLEGVAFRLRSIKDVLEENGIITRQIRASGGFTRSSLWLQIISDVMNQPLAVPKWGETSSLGAAFWVLLAIGAVESLEKFIELVHLGASYEPTASDSSLYDQLYRVYQEIYHSSLTCFDRLQTLRPD
jgi:gluconokinase